MNPPTIIGAALDGVKVSLLANVKCPHIFHAGCFASCLKRDPDTDGDPGRCPLCRYKWFDNDNEIDEAEDIIARIPLLDNDFFDQVSFTTLPIFIVAKDLVRSLEIAAYAALKREEAGFPSGEDARAIVGGMTVAIRKMHTKYKRILVLWEQLPSRAVTGMREFGDHRPYTDAMSAFAWTLSWEAVALYAWTHGGIEA